MNKIMDLADRYAEMCSNPNAGFKDASNARASLQDEVEKLEAIAIYALRLVRLYRLLQAALAEPSEPVAWRHKVLGRIETAEAFAVPYNWGDRSEWEPLFTHPAPSKPSELTDKEIWKIYDKKETGETISFARAILAAAREKAK